MRSVVLISLVSNADYAWLWIVVVLLAVMQIVVKAAFAPMSVNALRVWDVVSHPTMKTAFAPMFAKKKINAPPMLANVLLLMRRIVESAQDARAKGDALLIEQSSSVVRFLPTTAHKAQFANKMGVVF